MKYGAQLYTVREFCKDRNGFRKSLERIAQMGYSGVQISAVEAFENEVSPKETREWLDEFGLVCCATHRPWERLCSDLDREIDIHQTLGCAYIGVGMAPKYCYEEGPVGWRKWIDEALPTITRLSESGLHFCFHNHAIEWQIQDGERGWDILVAESDPRLQFILDTYWVVHAGVDCVRLIDQLTNRIGVVHLKDKVVSGWETRFAPVGGGNLNWSAIIPALNLAGTQWGVVEQDDCFGEDPFDCLARSLDFLREQNF